MSPEQTVVYTARTSQEAHLLRNLLTELGITAMVTNDALERGSGVDILGWPTSARVVVAEEDGPRARQIVLKFERQGAPAAANQTEEGPPEPEPEDSPTAMTVGDWPRCPGCDARRLTRCPICDTAGTDFSPVDMGFIWVPEAADAAGAASCSCGSDGCAPARAAVEPEGPADGPPPDSPRTMLICPTCDEPFEPRYPRVCEWCGHRFDDGVEMNLPQGEVEQLDARAIAVIVGLLVLLGALVAYFMFIV